MNKENVTYISIGSNVGNRLHNIENAMSYIMDIGRIEYKSKYYKSESWGFNSSYFINNIIVLKTKFSPIQLLDLLKRIEVKLGAIHDSNVEGYIDRIIDIDIIYYNNIIYKQKVLVIPHINMHNRKFVLLPMMELKKDIIHPIFNKNVEELLENCNDKTIVLRNEE